MGWKCLLGHKGQWYYISATDCLQERICERPECRKRQTRSRHLSWTDWQYKETNSCEQERFCERCRDEENQTVHSWSSWRYKHPEGDCTEVRFCQRCEKVESRLNLGSHQYSQQEYYVFSGQCYTEKVCQRCNYKNFTMRKQHQWGEWFAHPQHASQLIRLCGRCNEKETQSL